MLYVVDCGVVRYAYCSRMCLCVVRVMFFFCDVVGSVLCVFVLVCFR